MTAHDEIQATLGQLVEAWNKNDMSVFASLFIEDASYVSSVGVLLRGRQAIRDELADNMATSSDHGSVAFTNTSINLIKIDVAVVLNTWEMLGGDTAKWRRGVITQVLINDGERWRIAALQNTDVQT